jgi:hypothetical protein
LKNIKPVQDTGNHGIDQDISIDISMVDFEKRLGESLLEATRESSYPPTPRNKDAAMSDATLASISRALSVAEASAPPAEFAGSGLLAGLAREAREKSGNVTSTVQNNKAQIPLKPRMHAHAPLVDAALDRIAKFLIAFVQHVNKVEPAINRTYRLDARTIYANLKWQRANVEYRKLSLSDTAYLDFVTFSVDLCAPGPVLLKRTWNHFETLEHELQHIGLRVIDNLAAISKMPRQEMLEVRLAPNFPVQIKFKGNYEKGYIDVISRNIEAFGSATFKLGPGSVTPGLMDELGLFLLGRSNQLPEALHRI